MVSELRHLESGIIQFGLKLVDSISIRPYPLFDLLLEKKKRLDFYCLLLIDLEILGFLGFNLKKFELLVELEVGEEKKK